MSAGVNWAEVFQVLGGIGLLLTVLALYLLPLLLAWGRHHDQLTLIALVNLLFGWTVLGWLVALLWSIAAVNPLQATGKAGRPGPPPPAA